MTSSPRTPDTGPGRRRSWLSAGLAASAVVYPFLVYFGLGALPAGVFVALALVLLGARAYVARSRTGGQEVVPALAGAALILFTVSLLDAELGAKTYPVLMSLMFAGLFGVSLVRPPSLVERMVRLRGDRPDAAACAYMRRVSMVWCGFLVLNAAVSLATALSGDLDLWTLYNGLLSYFLIGALFAIEWLVRRYRLRQAEARS